MNYMMNHGTYYQGGPISSLGLHPRTRKLMDELMDAPKSYSTINAELAREAYGQHRGEPPILKRAHALAAQFDRMPIYIRDGELLAGNRSAGLGVMPRLPDDCHYAENPRTKADDARYEALELYGHYCGKLSPAAKAAQNCLLAGYSAGSADGFGHILADYGMILREGALALADRAERQAAVFDAAGKEGERDFCRASAISCRAFGRFGLRYSALAREEAERCGDENRRRELLSIAEICARVPSRPARNFYEAIQAMYLTHMAMQIEQHGGSISIGQFDRILYPYYLRDMQSGVLTVDFAVELTESFCVKVMENAIWPREKVMFANCAIGGCDAEGNDASNDLTRILLDCIVKTGSPHPLVSFRWHPAVPEDLWQRVVEIVGLGHGLPALFSDVKMMQVLESWGIPHELAADYGIVGCVEAGLNGMLHGQTLGGHVNLLLCLELAMNNGKSFMTGEQIGPESGFLRDFSRIDDLWDAYRQQVAFACGINREAVYAAAETQRDHYGYPLMSSLMEDAIIRGRDITRGVRWNYPTVCVTGLTNVADSFQILETLIEKKKRYTFQVFYDALKNNFAGYDILRAEILAAENCFGNQDAESIRWYTRICAVHGDIFKTQAGPRGGKFCAGLWVTTWHVSQGKFTGASADGRLAGDPLVDSVGPVTRRIMNGPLAAAADVAAIDSVACWPGGYVWNTRFSRELFAGQDNREKIAQFIAAYFKRGGMQMQVNTYSSALLREAQREPGKYRDLVVRVAGFSAYFCALSADVQNEIIARAELAV
jgi:formate C-acetyltransferase